MKSLRISPMRNRLLDEQVREQDNAAIAHAKGSSRYYPGHAERVEEHRLRAEQAEIAMGPRFRLDEIEVARMLDVSDRTLRRRRRLHQGQNQNED